jgi:hypothetical protein
MTELGVNIMIVHTHSAIGNLLYDYISNSTHLTVHKRSFLLGNVRPDIDPTLNSLTHRGKDLIEVLECLKDDLCLRDQSPIKFSEKLGILCHFMCDTFCRYHFYDSLWKKSIYEHIRYEIRLHFAFIASEKRFKKIIDHHISSSKGFVQVYKELTEQYAKETGEIERDIEYALAYCLSTIDEINSVRMPARKEHIA